MPELGYKPVNKYLPPRARKNRGGETGAPLALTEPVSDKAGTDSEKLFRWVDRMLSR